MTVFAILIAITSLTIILYSYTQNKKIIIEMGTNIVTDASQTVVEKFNEYIKPGTLLSISAALFDKDVITLNKSKQLASFMHILLQNHPQLTSVYVTDLHGNMYMETRVPETPNIHFTSS